MSEPEWAAVAEGRKTLHLFPPRKGEELIEYRAIYANRRNTWHLQFEVGQTRAVQNVAGGGAVGAVQIVGIAYVTDVRALSDEQIAAAGYETRHAFLLRWAQLHARSAHGVYLRWVERNRVTQPAMLESGWLNLYMHSTAPKDRWDAWGMTLARVESEGGT